MCAANVVRASAAAPGAAVPARQAYGTIVIVGGGCYGSYYVRQLTRARRAGVIDWTRVLVVDRSSNCRVARELTADDCGAEGVQIVTAEWRAYFSHYLAEACLEPGSADADAIVPSPLMPHLMFDWLRDRARERWPHRHVEASALPRQPAMPWQRATQGGTHYVSFAEWVCPVNCIEPPMCPVIRGPRSWSMPPAVRAYVEAQRARGDPMVGPVLFHCTHRAYGVGMFDTREAVAADRVVQDAGTGGPASVLVGTVSHCHGALDLLSIGRHDA